MIKRLMGREMQLPCIGKLFKGAPKETRKRDNGAEYQTFGKELDYWRFESDQKHVAEAFFEAFGAAPRDLPVYLPFRLPEENFQAWREAYTAGGLDHRCDGESCTVWLDKRTGRYSNESIPCPTLKMSESDAKRNGCKDVGRLQVIIPQLNELGFVTMETHSVNDILFLIQCLPAYASLQPKDGLRNIPMILSRFQAEISTPREGKRVRVKKWLVSLRPWPDWSRQYLATRQKEMLLSASKPLLLAPGMSDEPDAEDEETVYEAEVVQEEEQPKEVPKRTPSNGAAQSKFGKQIIAMMVPLKWSDAQMLAHLNKEFGLASTSLVETVDGITEDEQKRMIKELQPLMPKAAK